MSRRTGLSGRDPFRKPLAMTAGIETLKILMRSGTYEKLEARMQQLESGLKDAAERAGVPTKFYRAGSMFCTYFTDRKLSIIGPRNMPIQNGFRGTFAACWIAASIFAPSQFEAGFMSLAHSKTDIDKTVKAVYETLKEIR